MRGASPRGVILLLAFTWSVHLAANAAFLIRNPGEPPISDGTHQIASTYSVSTGLKVNGAAGLWLEARDSNAEWPPLVSMVTGLMAHLINASVPAVRLYNILFFGVLLVSVFAIGAQCHSREAGLVAAVCCSFLPSIFGASRQFGLDFPAAAMVAGAMALLLASRGFTRIRMSAACGVVLGLTALCRVQSIVFLAAPYSLVLARSLRQPHTRALALGGALACLAIALLVSAVWWWDNLPILYDYLIRHMDKETFIRHMDKETFIRHLNLETVPIDQDSTLFGGVKCYLFSWPKQTTAPVMVLTLALAPIWLWRARRQGRWELMLWLTVPLLAHILSVARHPRYLLPLLPVLPLLAAMGALSIERRALRRAAVAALLLLGVGAWIYCEIPSWSRSTGDLAVQPRPCKGHLCGDRKINPEPLRYPHRITLALGSALQAQLPLDTFVWLEEHPAEEDPEAAEMIRQVMLGLRGYLDNTFKLPNGADLPIKWQRLHNVGYKKLMVTAMRIRPPGAIRLVASWNGTPEPGLLVWEMPMRADREEGPPGD